MADESRFQTFINNLITVLIVGLVLYAIWLLVPIIWNIGLTLFRTFAK